jgi:type IV secretion system protein VirB10
MLFRFVALLLTVTVCSAQAPVAAPTNDAQNSSSSTDAQPSALVVLPGTAVPLTLLSTIRSRTSKPGDSVRAVVAFPVTVGEQIAIPAGTYVVGVINAVKVSGSLAQAPSVQIHFTRLLFANGYSTPLDAMNTQAVLVEPEPGIGMRSTDVLADAREGAPSLGEGFEGAGQINPEPPPLPPLPRLGPNPAVVVGVLAGGLTAFGVFMFAYMHHLGTHADFVVFDSGWQFQMVLDRPLTLDPVQVAQAAAMPAQ